MANAWQNLGVVANGTINPMTLLTLDATRDFAVIQASGPTVPIIGIAQLGPKIAPNLLSALGSATPTTQPAAVAEDSIGVFLPGEVTYLPAGTAGWNPRDFLTSDANGLGVAATSGQYYGAIALSAAASGDLGQVYVWIGKA